ncbi:MAG: hypothetical protein MUO64_12475 [Anaerolineales bacterium]|nr:hypothetical protein [Anaerolineales bacterium]
MGLLNLFKRFTDLRSMSISTLAKAKKHGGDPFYEYRIAEILPEKYEYGMNCLLDSAFKINGSVFVQKIYEELRKDTKNYRIEQNTSITNLPGIPVLFGLSLEAFLLAQDSAINRVKRKFIKNFFIDLSAFIYALKEDYKKYIDNEERILLYRIHIKKFLEHSDKLIDTIIFCKTKNKEYYDFLLFQGLRDGYAYDVHGRSVAVSESSMDDIIAMVSKAVRDKYFGDAKELSGEEGNGISVVYLYHDGKPAYQEGNKICILEDGYNIRVIENAEEEFKRTKITQVRKKITESITVLSDAIKTMDDSIQHQEDIVRDTEVILDEEKAKSIPSIKLLISLSGLLVGIDNNLNWSHGSMSKLKEAFDTNEESYRILSKEILTDATDASGMLEEIEKIRIHLRDMESRLTNISQKVAFMKKTITSLCMVFR